MKRELIQKLKEQGVDGLPHEWFSSALGEVEIKQSENIPEQSQPASIESHSHLIKIERLSSMSLETLKAEAQSCRDCRLCEERKNVVFGVGNTLSPLVCFVGEGPGADEDRVGEPFVGKAGELLTAAITKGLGLKREEVYICNVVKCRPPQNRTPLPDEVAACSPFLYRQIELIKPKVIVTLGAPAQLAISGKQGGITKIRGSWLSFRGIKVMPTFHPAYILRNPEAKRPFWEDLQKVMKELGLGN